MKISLASFVALVAFVGFTDSGFAQQSPADRLRDCTQNARPSEGVGGCFQREQQQSQQGPKIPLYTATVPTFAPPTPQFGNIQQYNAPTMPTFAPPTPQRGNIQQYNAPTFGQPHF